MLRRCGWINKHMNQYLGQNVWEKWACSLRGPEYREGQTPGETGQTYAAQDSERVWFSVESQSWAMCDLWAPPLALPCHVLSCCPQSCNYSPPSCLCIQVSFFVPGLLEIHQLSGTGRQCEFPKGPVKQPSPPWLFIWTGSRGLCLSVSLGSPGPFVKQLLGSVSDLTAGIPHLLSSALLCFTDVAFFTNWRQSPPPAKRLQLALVWHFIVVV